MIKLLSIYRLLGQIKRATTGIVDTIGADVEETLQLGLGVVLVSSLEIGRVLRTVVAFRVFDEVGDVCLLGIQFQIVAITWKHDGRAMLFLLISGLVRRRQVRTASVG